MTKKEHREQVVEILKKYLSGDITPKIMLESFPDYKDDALLESIINSYCEPLRDTNCPTWEVFTKICIKAMEENWSLEKFDNET